MSTVDPVAVRALTDRCRRDIDQGILPSCQVAVALEGEVVAFEAFGAATTDTRYTVYSAVKPFVASAMWQLVSEGMVDVDAPAGEYVPEFASNGKDVVTVEQVMLHTGGFPQAPLRDPEWETSAGRREAFARWFLNWEPGSTYEYHATSAHWVLAEIIIAVTGRDYRDEMADRVTTPLGLPRVLGLGPEAQDGIAEVDVWGEPCSPEELEAAIGVREIDRGEVTDEALIGFNRVDVRTVGVPGGGGVMRACDLARFYQGLLHNPDELWNPALLTDVTGRVRNNLPERTTKIPASRTLGLVVSGADGLAPFRGMGRSASPAAFGHNGAGGQVAFADPATGVSVAYCTNGLDANFVRQWKRGFAVASLGAACAVASAGGSG
jgi:CubicO group peptidase (beta-lactamase class C family)